MGMTIEEVLGHFEGRREYSDYWMALCPAHPDTDPSLEIRVNRGRVWLKCYGGQGGCAWQAVVAAARLKPEDLTLTSANRQPGTVTVESLAEYKGLPPQFLKELGVCDLPGGGVAVPYRNASGVERVTRIRTALKASAGSRWPKDSSPIAYGAERLGSARAAGFLVVAEGESDPWTAWFHHVPCLGLPGATMVKTLDAEHLDGVPRLYVVEETDEAGRQFPQSVAARCRGVEWRGEIRRLRMPDGLKDLNDLHRDDPARFGERLNAAMACAPEVRGGGLAFTPLGELLREPAERRRWVVDHLLLAGGTSIVVSKPKVGKSTLVRSLAFAVARGIPFLGRRTESGLVLYCTFEENRDQFRGTWSAMGVTDDERIAVYCDRAPGPNAVSELRDEIERKRPALVVIDTLFKLVRVKDTSAYAEVYEALEPLIDIARDTGTHIVCVHHSPKGERAEGDEALGSTAIFGSFDTMLTLRRTEHHRTVRSMQRYGVDLDETTLVFDERTQTVTTGQLRTVVDRDRVKDQILRFLQGREPATEREILDGVEGRTKAKVQALRDLVADGRVGKRGSGKRGEPYWYFYMSVAADLVSDSLVPPISGVRENDVPDPSSISDSAGSDSHSRFPEQKPGGSGTSGISNSRGNDRNLRNERNHGNDGNESPPTHSVREPVA